MKLLKKLLTLLLVCCLAACGEIGPQPDNPDNPDNPEIPDNPDKPDVPDNPDKPVEVVPSFALVEDIDEYVFTYELGSTFLETKGDYKDWFPESNAEWLQVRQTPTGAAPRLTLYVEQNGEGRFMGWGAPDDKPRSAEVKIFSKDKSQLLFTLTVWQDPYPYLASGEYKVSPDGGDYLLYIKANCLGWSISTELTEIDKNYYNNDWFQATRDKDGTVRLHIEPWNPDTEKPKDGHIGVRYYFNNGYYRAEYVNISYYDPSASGESSEYGEGGPWD